MTTSSPTAPLAAKPSAQRAAFAWGLAALVAAGCGGGDGPNLSDANRLLVEARQAIGDGNQEAALQALDASIAAEPNLWAYLERAKLHAARGSDEAALADCAEILKLQPDNRDVPWIKAELKKAAPDRFQGPNAIPPSFKK